MSLDVSLIYRPTKGDAITVFDANITHNLSSMARAAEIYDCLWYPSESGIVKAEQLIKPLTEGLKNLRSNKEYFEQFNSPNGWGMYERLVPWVQKYLEACIKYPTTEIEVSR